MKIFVNKDIKHFFLAIMVVLVNFLVLTEVLIWVLYEKFSFWLLFLSLLTTFAILIFSQTKQNVGGCSVTD